MVQGVFCKVVVFFPVEQGRAWAPAMPWPLWPCRDLCGDLIRLSDPPPSVLDTAKALGRDPSPPIFLAKQTLARPKLPRRRRRNAGVTGPPRKRCCHLRTRLVVLSPLVEGIGRECRESSSPPFSLLRPRHTPAPIPAASSILRPRCSTHASRVSR